MGIPLVASSRGNNSSARAEQIYTLVAALQALRSAPELIFLRHQLTTASATATATAAATTTGTATATAVAASIPPTSQPPYSSLSTLSHPHPSLQQQQQQHRSKAPATVAVDADILCDVFAAQLMAHKSTESLSTQSAAMQPDGTNKFSFLTYPLTHMPGACTCSPTDAQTSSSTHTFEHFYFYTT